MGGSMISFDGALGGVVESLPATDSYSGLIIVGVVAIIALNHFIIQPNWKPSGSSFTNRAISFTPFSDGGGGGSQSSEAQILWCLLVCIVIAVVAFLCWKFCVKRGQSDHRSSGAVPKGFGGFWPKRKHARKRRSTR